MRLFFSNHSSVFFIWLCVYVWTVKRVMILKRKYDFVKCFSINHLLEIVKVYFKNLHMYPLKDQVSLWNYGKKLIGFNSYVTYFNIICFIFSLFFSYRNGFCNEWYAADTWWAQLLKDLSLPLPIAELNFLIVTYKNRWSFHWFYI